MKIYAIAAVITMAIAACATRSPSGISLERPLLHAWLIDSEAGMLRADDPHFDAAMYTCQLPKRDPSGNVLPYPSGSSACYALTEADYKRILKYIVRLEAQVQECQGGSFASLASPRPVAVGAP